jgi:hypothetical protein
MEKLQQRIRFLSCFTKHSQHLKPENTLLEDKHNMYAKNA